jgi:hypothetical protein
MTLAEKLRTKLAEIAAEDAAYKEKREVAEEEHRVRLEKKVARMSELGLLLDPMLQEINNGAAGGKGVITDAISNEGDHISRTISWETDSWTTGRGDIFEQESHSRGKSIEIRLFDNGRIKAFPGHCQADEIKKRISYLEEAYKEKLNQWSNINEPDWRESIEEQVLLIVSKKLHIWGEW